MSTFGSEHGHAPSAPTSVPFHMNSCFTGAQSPLLPQLKKCLTSATRIDFLVAFLMTSGVELLASSLKAAVDRGVPVRIVCGDTLGITQPAALYRLRSLLGDKASLRFYREPTSSQQATHENQSQETPHPRSFHPKAWFFHEDDHTTLFLGSSNASRSALLDGVEWNVRLDNRTDPQVVATFQAEFERLYRHCSVEIDDMMLRRYSLHYRKPERHAPFDPPVAPPHDLPIEPAAASAVEPSSPERVPEPEMIRVSGGEGAPEAVYTSGRSDAARDAKTVVAIDVVKDAVHNLLPIAFPSPQPNDPQTEALYALRRTREAGNTKALVVAATGVGKTFLAAFDSVEFPRVLFLAHREELLIQAEQAFRLMRPMDETGFYTGEQKDPGAALLFASVQTLGKAETLAQVDFPQDRFDYVVIDEFHHAAADSYWRVLAHFQPRFLLGLTATPDRMDNQEVFSLCDYHVVYDVRLKEAIEKGWFAPFHYYGVACFVHSA